MNKKLITKKVDLRLSKSDKTKISTYLKSQSKFVFTTALIITGVVLLVGCAVAYYYKKKAAKKVEA
jgi:hypothetical protein